MTHSLVLPFLFQTLWICCFTHHVIGSGPRVVTCL